VAGVEPQASPQRVAIWVGRSLGARCARPQPPLETLGVRILANPATGPLVFVLNIFRIPWWEIADVLSVRRQGRCVAELIHPIRQFIGREGDDWF